MPVKATCKYCGKNKKIWLKQKHVVVQRCLSCNRIWPFGRANDRDQNVQLEILAQEIVDRGTKYGPEAAGWATSAQEYHGWPEAISLPVSEDTAWHAGWLAREILHGSDTEQVEPATGANPAGLAEMERIWESIKLTEDERTP